MARLNEGPLQKEGQSKTLGKITGSCDLPQ
ncbi:Protein of unknown function [Propionibacterium freudenreichii]|nr:Protein of unknown function [Propionibacterium freudenreichii]